MSGCGSGDSENSNTSGNTNIQEEIEECSSTNDLAVYSVKADTRIEDLFVGKISVNERQGIDIEMADINFRL